MDGLERKSLREQSLTSWADAKRLRLEATMLGLKTVEAGRHASEPLAHHNVPVEGVVLPHGHSDLSEEAAMVLARASGSTFFEDLVDHAIDLKSDIFAEVPIEGHIALAASSDPDKLIRIKQLLGTVVPYTLGVLDGATALGVVIATQPDLAIVDSNLELADGVDLTLTFPIYAPRTKGLALTDNPKQAVELRISGFAAMLRDASDSELLAWAVNAMEETL